MGAVCSGVFRGGGGGATAPPPFGVVYAGGGPGPPPPPLAVIRGAVGGVWLVFEEVYGVKSKKCEKLLKKNKKGRQNFFGREFWRLVCVLKKGRQIFWPPPPFQISKYATADSIGPPLPSDNSGPIYVGLYQLLNLRK
jgi:hypothetical protein